MTMRRLNVDLEELAAAMDQTERDFNDWFLDTQTGEILLVNHETLGELEDEEEEGGDVEQASEPMPDWQRDERELCAKIAGDTTGRYERIPENDSGECYRLMVEFAAQVDDTALQEKFERALNSRGPFRHFKDVLFDYPDDRRRWFDFENDRKRQWAREWLESLHIESIWQAPPRPN